MAPVEPAAVSQTNTWPLLRFSTQALFILTLTFSIVRTIRRASKTLSPPASTRSQGPLRWRHAVLFGTLGALSFASVTVFSVAWRAVSYLHWAESANHDIPGSLWSGWYGALDEGVGNWRLGDWMKDVHLGRGVERIAIGTPEGFAWTSQWFAGLLATSLFMGIEGYRRNLPSRVTTAFVLLAQFGSLGFALSLFFVAMLYTPVPLHRATISNRDVLWTPKPWLYWIPVLGAFAALYSTPPLLEKGIDTTWVKLIYESLPLYLAFATKIIPSKLGHHHASKAAAHQSQNRTFRILGWTSFILYWRQLGATWLANAPPKRESVYDVLLYPNGRFDNSERLVVGLRNAAQRLKSVSSDPIVNATSSDVVFAAISLCVWAFVRNLDVGDMLNGSALSFLSGSPAEKHVAFDKEVEKEPEIRAEVTVSPVTPAKKGRGRPRKNGNAAAPTPTANTGTLRRSTRRKTRLGTDSDREDSYEPPVQVSKEIAHTESDGSAIQEDAVAGGEATALGLFLTFVGGLGQLTASVLGAEVAGNSSSGD